MSEASSNIDMMGLPSATISVEYSDSTAVIDSIFTTISAAIFIILSSIDSALSSAEKDLIPLT
jgi:hypothetical protein